MLEIVVTAQLLFLLGWQGTGIIVVIVDRGSVPTAKILIVGALVLRLPIVGILYGLQVAHKVLAATSKPLIRINTVIATIQTVLGACAFIVGFTQIVW